MNINFKRKGNVMKKKTPEEIKLYKDLGANLFRIRTHKGISQETICNEFQVSRQTVSSWENGKAIIPLPVLIKLESLKWISLCEILEYEAQKLQREM